MKVTLEGYVHLARMIDKCRAVLAGTEGEYIYPCPMDERLMEFAGITAEQFTAAVKTHPTDEGWRRGFSKRQSRTGRLNWKTGIRNCWHADQVLLRARPSSKKTAAPSTPPAPI